jgi:hypothetical protein
MHWRNDPPTKNQLIAIRNKGKGFKINTNRVSTKGEAFDEIVRLNSIIEELRSKPIYTDAMSAKDEWAYEYGIGPGY